jgi:ABC-type amino acid transport substrate-binding protein
MVLRFLFLIVALFGNLAFLFCNEETIRVAVYVSPPFGIINADSTYEGLAVEIWDEIADELNLNYSYYPTNMEGLLIGLNDGTYDVAIGAITITPHREKIVDFSHALNPSGTGFAVSSHNYRSSFSAYWRPITTSLLRLLGMLFIGIVIFGLLIWIIETKLHKKTSHEKRIGNMGESLWWAIVTMSTVGYGDKVPLSRLGKTVAVIWIFTSIILVALFTARASSIFTITELDLKIQSESDLRNSRVGVAINSSGEEYCIRRNIHYYSYPNVEEALNDVTNGYLDAVVSNVPVLMYLKNTVFKDQIEISPQFLLKNNMGIALTPGSQLKEPINRILLQKVSEPNWRANIERYLGKY